MFPDRSSVPRGSVRFTRSEAGLLTRDFQRNRCARAEPTFPRLLPQWCLGPACRSQWRDRAGFAPDFPIEPKRAPPSSLNGSTQAAGRSTFVSAVPETPTEASAPFPSSSELLAWNPDAPWRRPSIRANSRSGLSLVGFFHAQDSPRHGGAIERALRQRQPSSYVRPIHWLVPRDLPCDSNGTAKPQGCDQSSRVSGRTRMLRHFTIKGWLVVIPLPA